MLRQHEHFKLVSIFVVLLQSDMHTHSCTSETRCQYLSVTCLPPPRWASAHCLHSLPAWHLVCINYVIVSNCQSKTIYMITHHLPFIGGIQIPVCQSVSNCPLLWNYASSPCLHECMCVRSWVMWLTRYDSSGLVWDWIPCSFPPFLLLCPDFCLLLSSLTGHLCGAPVWFSRC